MLRKPLKLPVRLARILALLLLCALALLSVLLPTLIDLLCEVRAGLHPELPPLPSGQKGLLLALAYVMVLVAAGAILFLIRLLRSISRGKVFSESTVLHLLAVSLCCFFEAQYKRVIAFEPNYVVRWSNGIDRIRLNKDDITG